MAGGGYGLFSLFLLASRMEVANYRLYETFSFVMAPKEEEVVQTRVEET